MPVIVVGADTPAGASIVERLLHPEREIRAFVSDADVAAGLREQGVKVALGDVSDESHVEAAATRCFTAVLVAEAAEDGRERSFASDPASVLVGWARAAAGAHVARVIWVSTGETPAVSVGEVAVVSPADEDFVATVLALDEAQTI